VVCLAKLKELNRANQKQNHHGFRKKLNAKIHSTPNTKIINFPWRKGENYLRKGSQTQIAPRAKWGLTK